MISLFLTTTISCYDVLGIIHRLKEVAGLTQIQKYEIIQEVRKTVPSCPIIIKKDGKQILES